MSRLRRGCSQQAGNLPQFGTRAIYCCGNYLCPGCALARSRSAGQWQRRLLWFPVAMHMTESLAGARKRIALGMNQALDFQSQFHVAPPIKPLAGSTFIGLELWKLRFPKAQDVRLYVADTCHIADLEIKAIGNRRRIGCTLWRRLGSHHKR